jgi:nucleoside-diphosphate-sugar epimerase
MSRILLTGGSGFIAAHVLETLLQRGHSVVTTVRSPQKGKSILDAHPNYSREVLDFVVVEDIARANGVYQHKHTHTSLLAGGFHPSEKHHVR